MQHRLLWFAFFLATAHLTHAQNSNLQLRSTVQYPGQTLANVCGWTSPDGREYALIGGSQGMIITDITDPTTPVQVTQIPGPNNLWKEIKTYSHYAYVTSEGGGGVQIVDLSTLPGTVQYHNYYGTGPIAGQMDAIHALHIDVKKGFLYTYGGDLNHGVVHDLNTDPYNPTYAGEFDQLGYIHDGYADNDTLYACHIYTGLLSIVDMNDKSNPVLLGTVETPGKFTHNSWLLDDHKHILTTDEATPSFLACYDISDPTNPIELDRFSIDNGNNSIGHNTHVLNDWAITSWYTGGVVITDCHRPNNLVRVAQYDTWDGTGANFDGCWGVYPFFPSGNIIASNIEPAELFVLTPTYQRAAYLEGVVRNGCNNQPLIGAQVRIIGGDALATALTDNAGEVRTGQVATGNFSVEISKSGFVTQTIQVTLATAEVTLFDMTLAPTSAYTLSGSVVDENGTTIPNVPVVLTSATQTYEVMSNANGEFSVECANSGTYAVDAGVWGFYTANAVNVTLNGNTSVAVTLTRGYYDNFNLDYGWTVEGDASAGIWERGKPVGTTYQGQMSNPDNDVLTDLGNQCYITGNGGGQAGSDDVDNGDTRLSSPPMELAQYADAVLTFSHWFFNDGGDGNPNDYFEVRVSNGNQEVTLLNDLSSSSEWAASAAINLADYVTLTDNVRVIFIAADDSPGHLVEAGVDVFRVVPITVRADEQAFAMQVQVAPNPSSSDFVLNFLTEKSTPSVLEVRDALGRIVESYALISGANSQRFGQSLLPGVYFVTLRAENALNGTTLRVVKQ
jgi:choice-of-anchor B domain-containing protein